MWWIIKTFIIVTFLSLGASSIAALIWEIISTIRKRKPKREFDDYKRRKKIKWFFDTK